MTDMQTITYDRAKYYPIPIWLSAHGSDFSGDVMTLADAILNCLIRAGRGNIAFDWDEAKIRHLVGMLMHARRVQQSNQT